MHSDQSIFDLFSAGGSADGAGPIDQVLARSVLIVEDDPAVIQITAELLCSTGLDILVALDGSEALRVFCSECASIACVLLDYEIPGVHPARLVGRFKQLSPEVKILISSGYSRAQVMADLPSEQVDAFFSKPFDPQSLLSAVQCFA